MFSQSLSPVKHCSFIHLLIQTLLAQLMRKLKQRARGREQVNKRAPVKAHHIPVFARKNKKLQKPAVNPCVFNSFCIITHSAPRFPVISKWHTSRSSCLLLCWPITASPYFLWHPGTVGDILMSVSQVPTWWQQQWYLWSWTHVAYTAIQPVSHYPLALETFLNCFWQKGFSNGDAVP